MMLTRPRRTPEAKKTINECWTACTSGYLPSYPRLPRLIFVSDQDPMISVTHKPLGTTLRTHLCVQNRNNPSLN